MNVFDSRKTVYLFTTVFVFVMLVGWGIAGYMIYSLLNPPVTEQQETATITPYREPTPEENKYSVKLYNYTLNETETAELKAQGLTDDEIENLSEDQKVEKLYGTEAMINNKYIGKNSSMYRDASEPTEQEREAILKKLLELYRSQSYDQLITEFGKYQKDYLFESFLDAPINALYHDAEIMKDYNEQSETIQNQRLASRQSIYSIIYDLNHLSTIQGSDPSSCMLLKKIGDIVSVEVIEDVYGDKSQKRYATDLIYKVIYKDINNVEGTVWIGDVKGFKYLIKLDPGDGCIPSYH